MKVHIILEFNFQMSEEDVATDIGDLSIPCEILEEIFQRLQTKFLLTQVRNILLLIDFCLLIVLYVQELGIH